MKNTKIGGKKKMKKLVTSSILVLIALFSFAMAESSGYLSIETIPSGASVKIDGVYYGTTSMVEELSVGDHKISLKVSDYDTYETTVTIKENETTEKSVALVKEIKSEKNEGGSFYIQKGKTILGLTSEYDGKGFGVPFSVLWESGIRLTISQGNLREIKILPKEESRVLTTLHQKQLDKALDYRGFREFNSFEILSNIDPENVKSARYIVRVTDKTLIPDNFRLIVGNNVVECEQMQNRLSDTYFMCAYPALGLITSAEIDASQESGIDTNGIREIIIQPPEKDNFKEPLMTYKVVESYKGTETNSVAVNYGGKCPINSYIRLIACDGEFCQKVFAKDWLKVTTADNLPLLTSCQGNCFMQDWFKGLVKDKYLDYECLVPN